MKTARACLLIVMTVLASGCPDTIGTVTSTIDTWSFTMGNRGGGIVQYHWIGPENAEKSGECRDPACRLTLDDLTLVRLSPVADNHFKFTRWDGDSANGVFCAVESQDAAGTILLHVSRDGACIAVFEAITGTPSTPPGAR